MGIAWQDSKIGVASGRIETGHSQPVLASDEVHVHSTLLGATSGQVQELVQLLSPDEQGRADRFYARRDRDRFVIAHGWLRLVLSSYLQVDPRGLHFSHSHYGRPYLDNLPRGLDICFNLSHSGQLALVAVALGRTLGADVERIHSDFPCLQVAESFFSEHERACLRDLPATQQHQAFYNCWTRKEAYIKALGEGLSHPLDQFDVSLVPDEPARLLATRPDAAEAAHWSLASFAPSPGYVGALAVKGPTPQVQYFPTASSPLL